MNESTLYRFIEFIIFVLYLSIIFLSTQIWFIWIDVDKKKLKSIIFVNDSFLKNNIVIVFSIGVFFMSHEFVEGTGLHNSYLYFEFFELIGFFCIALFLYKWHSILKICANKKPIEEYLPDACISHKVKAEWAYPICSTNRITKPVLLLALGSISLMLIFFVPISTICFALIIGLLFVPPTLALALTLIGTVVLSKGLSPR